MKASSREIVRFVVGALTLGLGVTAAQLVVLRFVPVVRSWVGLVSPAERDVLNASLAASGRG